MIKNKKNKIFNKKAFSLMELMVVIIILGLLAVFVLPSLTSKGEEAKKSIVCIQMKSISQALKMYKINTSSYPTTSEGLESLAKKDFFEDKKLPKDSWKKNFVYTSNDDGYDIISFGPNKTEGGGDDIYFSKCQDSQ
jgi:general secretion pathway protein G